MLCRAAQLVVPLLERSIFLLEMLAGTGALIWLWLARRWPRERPREEMTVRYRVLRLVRGTALVAFAGAFVGANRKTGCGRGPMPRWCRES